MHGRSFVLPDGPVAVLEGCTLYTATGASEHTSSLVWVRARVHRQDLPRRHRSHVHRLAATAQGATRTATSMAAAGRTTFLGALAPIRFLVAAPSIAVEHYYKNNL